MGYAKYEGVLSFTVEETDRGRLFIASDFPNNSEIVKAIAVLFEEENPTI